MSLYLAKDQRSNEVVALQNALNAALDPAKPLALDGIFGDHTESAVQKFQKQHGLKVDGIAGPYTLGALFKGVDVTARIHLVASADVDGGRQHASPYDVRRPRRPRPADDAPSFGSVGVLGRDWLVRKWIRQEPPKAPPDLPPVPHGPQFIDRPASADRLRLTRHFQQGEKRLERDRPIDVEVGGDVEGVSSKEIKEVAFTLSTRLVVTRFKPWLVPSLSLLASPDGYFRGKVELTVTPFGILGDEWKRWSFEVSPLLRASYTMPAILGVDPSKRLSEFGVFGGLSAEIARKVGKRGTQLFLGGSLGFRGLLELDRGKVVGRIEVPEVSASLGAGVRF